MAWTEKLPSGRYRAAYRTHTGQLRYAPGTFTHKAAAQRTAAALEEEARNPTWRDPQAATQTWGTWARQWFPNRAVDASTQTRDASRMKTLTKKWEHTPLHEINRNSIKTWAAELLAADLAPATVARHISLFSASLTAAVDANIIPVNPATRLGLKLVTNPSERVLSLDEQRALFNAMPTPRDQALLATLLGTGGRWSEVVALAAQHYADGRVRYRRAWDIHNRELKPYTKGKKRRSVPFAPWLQEIVNPIIETTPTGFLYHSKEGNPLDYGNWRTAVWTPAIEQVGLNQGEHDDRVTIHTLRHTFATEQLNAGATLAEIATLLGHSSLQMAERYAHRAAKLRPGIATAIKDPRALPEPPETPSNVIQFPRKIT